MNLETEGAYAFMRSVCTCSYLAAVYAGQWPASSHRHFIVLLSGWVEKALSLVVIKKQTNIRLSENRTTHLRASFRSLVTILTQLPASHNPCLI